MNKIYIVTDGIPLIYGGRSKSLLNRARLFAGLGYEVTILLVSQRCKNEYLFEKLYQENVVPRSVKFISMLMDIRKPNHDSKNIEFIPNLKKLEKKAKKRRVYTMKEDRLVKKHYCTLVSETTRYYTHDSTKDERTSKHVDHFDVQGNLVCRVFYNIDQDVKTRVYYYNEDETIFMKSDYLIDEKLDTSVECNIDYINGKYISTYFSNIDDLRAYWLEQIISEPNAKVIVDSRRLDMCVLQSSIKTSDVFFFFHNSHARVEDGQVKKSWSSLLSNKQNYKVISLTQSQKEDIVKVTDFKPRNIFTIPHAIKRCTTSQNYEKHKIVSVSRLDNNQKNITDIVAAFALFSKKHPEFTYEIWGHGPDEDDIKRQIAKRKLGEKVKLMGYTNNPQEVFRSATMSICASNFEGFCLSVAESIACGCPVASYNVKYGPSDIIEKGHSGCISKKNTPKSLAIAMSEVLCINKEFTREQIASDIDKFSEESITEHWKQTGVLGP